MKNIRKKSQIHGYEDLSLLRYASGNSFLVKLEFWGQGSLNVILESGQWFPNLLWVVLWRNAGC